MADEENKTTPRKRAPRKKLAETPENPLDPGSESEPDPAEGGILVMTASSRLEDSERSVDTAEAVQPELGHGAPGPVIGQLVVHASTRDISIPLDGESTSRVMAVFAGTRFRRDLEDVMVVGLAEMRHLWASIDLAKVIALSWIPALPSASDRVMTVDPPLPDALAL